MSYDYEAKARDILHTLRFTGANVRDAFLAAALHHAHDAGRAEGLEASARARRALERRIEHARKLHPETCRCETCAALDCPFGEPRHYAEAECPMCDTKPGTTSN